MIHSYHRLDFTKLAKTTMFHKKGDIIVLEAVENHPRGHIAMYSGNKWISDFVQSDMWGGSAYIIKQNIPYSEDNNMHTFRFTLVLLFLFQTGKAVAQFFIARWM